MFRQVDYGFLLPARPDPWPIYKLNLVDQSTMGLCRGRRSWEDLMEVTKSPYVPDPSLTSLCGAPPQTESRYGLTSTAWTTKPPTPTTQTPGRAVDTTLKSPIVAAPAIAAPTGITSGLSRQAISTTTGATPMVSTSNAGSLGSLLGAGVGSVIPGAGTILGGTVGGLLGTLGSLGKSKCPGPYNYNAQTGGCDPKPGTFVGGTGATTGTSSCPSGSTYDPATGQCKVGGLSGWVERTMPGGATGYVGQEFTPTTAYGMQGFVPMTVPTQRLQCPAGYVLFGNKNGKAPGMEVCLPKGFLANRHRKWPKPPRPAMSAQDVKTLNRINAIQRKVSNMAVRAGYRKPRKR